MITNKEELKDFEQKWKREIEEIKESEFSPKQCRKIEEQFIQDIRRITTKPNQEFEEMMTNVDKAGALKSELIIALQKAKSNYRKNQESLWEQLKIKIERFEIKILDLL